MSSKGIVRANSLSSTSCDSSHLCIRLSQEQLLANVHHAFALSELLVCADLLHTEDGRLSGWTIWIIYLIAVVQHSSANAGCIISFLDTFKR